MVKIRMVLSEVTHFRKRPVLKFMPSKEISQYQIPHLKYFLALNFYCISVMPADWTGNYMLHKIIILIISGLNFNIFSEYKLVALSPRTNLYLYSGNYGEDTIQLLTITCFLGGVVSVTDKQFKVSNIHN